MIFAATLSLVFLVIAVHGVAEHPQQPLHGLPRTGSSWCPPGSPDWTLKAFFLHLFPWLPPWPPPLLPLELHIVRIKNSSTRYIQAFETSKTKEYHPLQSISWTTAKQINSNARTINGNRKERGIKILHWNKGPSYLENKYDEVEAIIENHKPHVLGLSESNLRADHDLTNVQYKDYDLHTALSLHNHQLKVSRVVVYTHKSLVVKEEQTWRMTRFPQSGLRLGCLEKEKS